MNNQKKDGRRFLFLVAGAAILITLGLGVLVSVPNQKLLKQYEASMDEIKTMEEKIVQINSQLKMSAAK